MKKSFFALAAFGAFSGSTYAQSNVVLYGVVDAPVEYINNIASGPPTINPTTGAITQLPGGSRFALQTGGGLSGSRWGLRGTEDIGSGLKALFVLESGFGINDGKLQQFGRMFGRQAFVGLESAIAGKLTFGRQYTTLFELLGNFNPAKNATMYEPIVAQSGTNFRSDNVLKYTGTFGGLTAEAHWSFGTGVGAIGVIPLAGGGAGEVPGHFRDDTGYGAGVAYFSNGFGITAVYDQWNPAAVAGSPGKAQKAVAAISYATGPAKVMGGYRWGRAVDSAGNTLLRDDYFWIGANYSVTPALDLTLGYYYDNLKTLKTIATQPNINVANPWQVSFIADYSFSKRTDVYLTTAYSKNAGLNFDTSAISFANGYFLAQGKSNQFGAAVGIRHKF